MSHEQKQTFLFVYRLIAGVGILASTGMLAFVIWAHDARVKEIGDARYVQKENYRDDQRRLETTLAELKNKK